MAGKTRTILHVDESATTRYYHGILLKRLEYAVLTAPVAEDALKIMEHTIPSLILTALSFSGMSGADFIMKIKSTDYTKDIPVVALTGEEDAAIRSACLSMGCTAYLVKPVEPYLLYRTIQSALELTPRKNIRLTLSLKVAVGDGTAQGGAERIEYASMISEGGLYLRTLYPQPKNTVIPVRIFIKDRVIRATVKVLYSNTLEGGTFCEPGMGMKFLEISEDDRGLVRRFIREQLTSDIAIDS